MAELPERDAALLLDMLLASRDAQGFVEGLDESSFLASRLHQNAAIRSLEVVGEAASKVSEATQAAHPEIPWRDITCATVSFMVTVTYVWILSGWCFATVSIR
jgi:uncharacterized protein with HEPN domain